ncbi:hypothetical protein ASD11_01255 [Aeromicrobium sp. Root495]|uniref:phage portal protein n=1 Tax=Aeromicrobium sp. Root495 TaxID=1736550 RepID=UPI0006FD3D48|nr:phage portal protein [Aeromicrobium sp. Root495]KQY58322.1 hypothetical protein ASD11_01255 [Aeromicrobium sp. Root495]
MVVFQTLGELSTHLEDNGGGVLDVVDPGYSLLEGSFDPRDVWSEQPSVRKVVDFIARGHAPIPRNLYRRVSDTERERVTDHPIARMLKQPNTTPGMTAYRFWHTIIVDYLIYDRWCILPEWKPDGELELHRVPARKVRFKTNGLDEVTHVVMFTDGQRREYDASKFILDHGYAHSGANGTSPMTTLSDILREQTEAVQYRRDVWKRGARFGGVVTRKTPWPNDKARNRFRKGFTQFARGGAQSGGWLMLEDDMDAKALDGVKPSDTEDLAGRTLSDIQTSSAYHIAPELIGAREGNFSNVKAFMEALYGPALGPIITSVDQSLNAWLTRATDLYIEANVDAMLRGNFEDQLKTLQSAIGAPWLSRNEGRALRNLPPVDGGDELVTPLNVLIGGQANPRDSAPKGVDYLADLVPPEGLQSKAVRTVRVKARANETYTAKTVQVLSAFFARQSGVVLSALGADDDDWWDGERWDTELAQDLFKLASMTSEDVAKATLEDAGLDPDEYDVDRTLKFLNEVAKSRAAMVNATTKEKLDAKVRSDDEDDAPADVFAEAKDSRGAEIATTLITTFSSFGAHEAAQQFAPDTATKTWIVTSSNPRSSHASMAGETVPIGEKFSNGMDWPGDPGGGADEVAGCLCDLEMTFS